MFSPRSVRDSYPVVEDYGLAPITFEQRLYFQEVFSQLKDPTTDYSFVNVYPYANSLNLSWQTIHRHLCIFMSEDNFLHMILPPVPERGATLNDFKNALTQCFSILNHHNAMQGDRFAGVIYSACAEILERVAACGIPDLAIGPSFGGGDYVYDMQKMITLSGNSLSSKRYAKNKFMRDFPNFYTKPLVQSDIPACMKLLDEWNDHKHQQNISVKNEDVYRNHEKLGCHIAMTQSEELQLKGMVLFVDQNIIGFTLGEALTPTQASILYEKTHPAYDGASAYIFSEFCRQFWSAYPECNVSDDANIPSLRFAKEQYRPTRILKKWKITQSI